MERLTWNEIKQKYPNQYVGLKDTIKTHDGELDSAAVLFHYTYDVSFSGMNCSELCSIFWTGELHECPSLHLPGVKTAMVTERLPWSVIVERYPDQWIGIINTLWIEKDYPVNVDSAIVIVTEADWSLLQSFGIAGYLDVIPTADLLQNFSGTVTVTL